MRTAVVIVALILSGLVTFADTAAVDQRRLAPNFTLETMDGKRISLSSYRGRVVLLDLWATWCTGCKVEIPWFVEFDKKYRRRGLTTIGASMDEHGKQDILPYLKDHPISYPIVFGYPALVTPYQITSLPVTLLIDKAGRIADVHAGVVDKDEWERDIRALLKERL